MYRSPFHGFSRQSLPLALRRVTCLLALAPALALAEPVQFDIRAQPLGSALNRLAEQSGLQVIYDGEMVLGISSQGIRGREEPEAALERMLQGSGLTWRSTGTGSVMLEKLPQQGGTMQLGTTTVSGQSLGQTTEGTGSYTTGPMQTATRLSLSNRETPQSVTVITRQRMDDQNMRTLEDVLKSTPGVSMTKDGPQRPIFYSRGFAVDNLMTDGLAVDMSHYLSRDMNSAPDMAIYDRVEVVRGATGLMQGTGSPSAAINLVRKRPTSDPRLSITGSAGSWDNYRSEVDISGPLNDSASLRGRVVTAYQTKDSFQDVANSERSVFYAIGEADLNDDSTFTFGASNQKANNTTTWGGLPVAINGSDLHLSRSSYLGSDWEYWDQDNTTAFSRLEYRFANAWKMQLSASKSWSELKMLGSMTERFGANDEEFGQYVGQYHYKDQQSSYDAYANGPFSLFGRTHELVVGASQRQLAFEGKGHYRDDPTNTNIYNPDPHSVPKPYVNLDRWTQDRNSELNSTYLTSRFNVTDSLKLILGGRLDWYHYDVDTRSDGVRTASSRDYKVTRNVTRYAGAIYDLDQHHSVYVSYTDIFQPQGSLDVSQNIIKPVVGKNYEMGIKGEYFDGGLNASAAIFRIDQENKAKELSPNACPGRSCYEAAGKVRSEGLDLEINGTLATGWELGAGYTFAQVKYVKDSNPENVGRLFDTDIPRHVFKAFTTYQLPGDLSRWTIGGGLYRQNTIYNEDVNFYGDESRFRVEQKAYTLVDLMTRFKATDNLEVRLNLNNVFDKKYYQAISTNTYYGGSIYGEPRNAMLTVRWSL